VLRVGPGVTKTQTNDNRLLYTRSVTRKSENGDMLYLGKRRKTTVTIYEMTLL
jgi:hypothetical protein